MLGSTKTVQLNLDIDHAKMCSNSYLPSSIFEDRLLSGVAGQRGIGVGRDCLYNFVAIRAYGLLTLH